MPSLGLLSVHVDCAICADGYAPGVAYSCHECSGSRSRLALGFTIFLSLSFIVIVGLLFSHLRSVVHEGSEQDTGVARGFWRQKHWYCQTFLVKMLPLTAIKIVVTVWQIISQVQGYASMLSRGGLLHARRGEHSCVFGLHMPCSVACTTNVPSCVLHPIIYKNSQPLTTRPYTRKKSQLSSVITKTHFRMNRSWSAAERWEFGTADISTFSYWA